ncbi:MAG TPA: class F sortase [Candidatus Saccharimonadales bacterium]|nr:class F sortase [Candidatus Saccharimonadales bacterium]
MSVEVGKFKFAQKHLGLVLIIIGIAGWTLCAVLLLNHQKPPVTTTAHAAPAPSDQRPPAKVIENYTVPAADPKYISIPEIKVPKSRIMQLGLMKDNQIAVPGNIYDAGWYNKSARPGAPGAMFIYGHVSSWEANGLFYDLKKLAVGDKVYITRGDDKKFAYQVVTTKTYPYNQVNMEQVLATYNGIPQGLNLMTCTGKVIKGTSEFSERLVIFTKPIPT